MTQLASSTTGIFNVPSLFKGDLAFVLIAFAISFIVTVYFGRGVIVSLILSFYASIVLHSIFPFTSKLIFLSGEKLQLINSIVIFFAFLIPLTIIIDRFVFSPSEFSSSLGIFKTVAYSLSATILIVSFSYLVINYDLLHDFSAKIDMIYSISGGSFALALLPLLILAFL